MEKTLDAAAAYLLVGKHLHGRGEDLALCPASPSHEETPPRTWRRPSSRCSRPAQSRNTSTDVEKTLAATTVGNYALETPPRTWRRRRTRLLRDLRGGNTSTDVEKTQSRYNASDNNQETPPRTWRRQLPREQALAVARNTSTDVEKTRESAKYQLKRRKHLHGRGEDPS